MIYVQVLNFSSFSKFPRLALTTNIKEISLPVKNGVSKGNCDYKTGLGQDDVQESEVVIIICYLFHYLLYIYLSIISYRSVGINELLALTVITIWSSSSVDNSSCSSGDGA